MKARTLWWGAIGLASAGSVMSVVAALLSSSLARYLFLLTAAVFAASAAVIAVGRGRSLKLLDKESEIACQNHTRPGIEKPAEERPVPKGKMPKQ